MSVAIAGWKAASPEEQAEFRALIGGGSAAAKPAKATKAKVVKTPMPLPEGMPSAADYRMTASSIDDSVCVGRAIGEEDKRWRPFVFRETQCGEKLAEGSDLCKKCTARAAKYAAEPKPGPWTGRVTEDPLDWVHMLGTVWAEEKKPKFSAAAKFTAGAPKAPAGETAGAASAATASLAEEEFAFAAEASATVVVSTPEPAFSSSSSVPVPAAPVVDKVAAKAAAAAAAAAAKAAAKEAEKAAKAAAKEAEKAAIKAVKDKAKQDAAAAVAAAKEKAKAAKPSAAKPAAAVKVTAPATASATAAAASDVTPISVEGELKLIDGSLYMVKNGNVYEYDELTEKAGDFVGRITAEETIDTEGAEVGAAESDTD